jgi:MtfA peptidase
VENFFERPAAFRQQLPSLYNAMCNLLNQDMLDPGLFVKPIELV